MYNIQNPGISGMRDYWAQLAAIRGITSMADCLHEAQVIQLKYWGGIAFAFAGPGKWKAEVNFENATITYVVKSRAKQPGNLKKLIAALDRSVQAMLGDEWALNVTINNKLVHRGQRKALPGIKTNEQRKRLAEGNYGRGAPQPT